MIETIMVMLVVVILLSLALFFYFKFSSSRVSSTSSYLSDQESAVLLGSITSMPELQCSFRKVAKPCIDASKLFNFDELINKYPDYYSSLFGYKTIKLKQVYPYSPTKQCSLSDFQDPNYPRTCGVWIVYNNPKPGFKENITISTPVSLYFPSSNIYNLGVLSVGVYK